ncbi:zf-HC2 domain-containing protein [Candidatus Villigracilis affinis]|uniref:anti-sigma factor family protein n=1 Tax=Candidatus Villigracilis affinis TaxID=3140682 RepID=UPI002A1DB60D|nr:zf-HC2 domain-containing protein [Anaerolineales bacterium]
MSNHVTEWLNAYLDDELKNGRLDQVEKHLAECEECQAELESLQNLSSLLHEVPAPEFISSERFASQVSLRLPHEQPRATKRKAQEMGWWMIPVSLLLLWVLIGTSEVVSEVISTADRFGLLTLGETPAWLAADSSTGTLWSGTLEEFGLLSGNSLQWAELTESFTRNKLPQIVLQVAIALLYLSWIAIWWARQKRREHGQLLEG